MVVIARSGAAAAVLNAAIGIGLATTLWEHPHVALLLAAIGLACYVSNRIYTGLAHRHRRLQTHYEFVSSVVRSTDLAEITRRCSNPPGPCCGPTTPSCCCGRRPRTSRPGASGSSLRPETTTEVPSADHVADVRALMPDGDPVPGPPRGRRPPWLKQMTPNAALAAPITGTDRSVVGALVVTQARRKAASCFGDSHTSLLGSLAVQASIAIENGMLFHRLEQEADDRAHQALHDPLTGLPNRSLHRAARHGAGGGLREPGPGRA